MLKFWKRSDRPARLEPRRNCRRRRYGRRRSCSDRGGLLGSDVQRPMHRLGRLSFVRWRTSPLRADRAVHLRMSRVHRFEGCNHAYRVLCLRHQPSEPRRYMPPDDAGSYCLSGDYVGQYDGGPGYQCECGDASACPGATQVCVPLGNVDASFCLTCGEATTGSIDGAACRDGGACQENLARCQ